MHRNGKCLDIMHTTTGLPYYSAAQRAPYHPGWTLCVISHTPLGTHSMPLNHQHHTNFQGKTPPWKGHTCLVACAELQVRAACGSLVPLVPLRDLCLEQSDTGPVMHPVIIQGNAPCTKVLCKAGHNSAS